MGDFIAGETFGDRTVEGKTVINGRTHYVCRCSRGHVSTVDRYNLVSGRSRGCKLCQRSEYTGEVYGELRVVGRGRSYRYGNSWNVQQMWVCVCEKGHKTELSQAALRKRTRNKKCRWCRKSAKELVKGAHRLLYLSKKEETWTVWNRKDGKRRGSCGLSE